MSKFNFNARRTIVFKDTSRLPNSYKNTDKTNRRTIVKIVTEKAEDARHNISKISTNQHMDITLLNIRITPINKPISIYMAGLDDEIPLKVAKSLTILNGDGREINMCIKINSLPTAIMLEIELDGHETSQIVARAASKGL